MAKAAVDHKKTRPKKPQHPQQRKTMHARPTRLLVLAGVGGLIALAGIGIVLTRGSGGDTAAAAAAPLPHTSDYHPLLVAPNAPDQLVLGTHQGLFRSTDGGRTWAQAELVNQDAMNLARASGKTIWAAGHGVLARSSDGGSSWKNVQPRGLPASLDVHGFAVDSDSGQLWAAVAGKGLYRSDDGGASFSLVTRKVGAGVMGLEVRPGGYGFDSTHNLLMRSDNGGTSWRGSKVPEPLLDLAMVGGPLHAVLVTSEREMYAAIDGGAIKRSVDGGRTWQLRSKP